MDSTEHIEPKPLECSVAKGPTDTSGRPMEVAQRSELSRDGQSEPSPGILRLPFEIVAYVFEIYANDNSLGGAFALGAICQGWRHIAWTTPQLWTTLDFHLSPKTTKSQIELAIEWLNRSGELPLSVILDISSDRNTKEKELLCLPLIDAIYQSLSRCRHLELSNITSSTFSRFSPLRRPSILQSLQITAATSSKIISSLNLGSKVAPAELSIYGIHLNFIGMNWNNLTEFDAFGLYLDEVLQALILAPQMKSCGQHDAMNRWQPNGYKMVIHSQLQSLYLVDMCGVVDIFFDKTTFSNLLKLQFEGVMTFPTYEFQRFLNRSSCAIESLNITHANIESTDLIAIAQALPSITHLALRHPTYLDFHPRFVSFYQALCRDSRYARDHTKFPGDVTLLPSLQSLYISTIHPFPWKYLPGICSRNHHDSSSAILPARHLQYINIECDNFKPDSRVVDVDLECCGGKSQFFPTSLIDSWETFYEFMELKRSVELDLKIMTAAGGDYTPRADLFEQSYKKLEAMGQKAPQDIRKSFEHWTATTSEALM